MVRVSAGVMGMNIEERQQPLHAPQGTSAAPLPERSEASVARSHAEKSPAGMPVSASSSLSDGWLIQMVIIESRITRIQHEEFISREPAKSMDGQNTTCGPLAVSQCGKN